MTNISPYAFKDTKVHYAILDGLRGVVALMVVIYHIFEGYAFAGGGIIESLNHGYLAVDFFLFFPDSLLAMPTMTAWVKV